ncbi:hypothetical protein CDCA_CDCA06G1815 [Cyanidium caldarium]|uniref:Survival protein SurE-like phosphatase/nucleotidase domain-containing protein n=1 Tax=Cyanidium caldarium TaxID=2771 RepID=A0AAV9IU22_CYACA|nr:hypothetical protein CDCA_CDCA06G1815 [Cyanidium caldarium]
MSVDAAAEALRRPQRPCILLTNDDGVDSPLLLKLAHTLRSDYPMEVVVVAPKSNQSACSHRLTLATPMELRRRDDLGDDVYSLDGSPADCVITGTEPDGVLSRLNRVATLVVSGPNIGPNLAQDVLHSGTFSGARQAGFYGVPSMACSLAGRLMDDDAQQRCVRGAAYLVSVLARALPVCALNHGRPQPRRVAHHDRDGVRVRNADSDVTNLKDAAMTMPRTLDLVWDAFAHGDLLLNVNIPDRWAWGRWRTTHLGAIFYRDIFRTQASGDADGVELVTIGAHGRMEPMFDFVNSDVAAVQEGYASVTTLQTWPETHPLQANAAVVQAMALPDPRWGLPHWITSKSSEERLAGKRE